MAAQTNKPQNGASSKPDSVFKSRSMKNPFLFAGTLIILVITIIAFVFIPATGSSSGGRSQGALTFGSYNGKPISYEPGGYFASQIQKINDYLRQQGLNDANFQQYAFQVWRSAFESTVLRTALIDEVKTAGFRVSQTTLDAKVAENDIFKIDGKFSAQAYRDTALSRKLEIRKSAEEDLYIQRYYTDVYTMTPGTKETDFISAMAKDRRTISYAAFSLASYPDSELLAWAKNNSGFFRKVKISRITLTSSESDAKKVLKQVQDKALTFEEAAKSHSKDPYADKGGDSGALFFHDFADGFAKKEDAEAVAALKKGDISAVYKVSDKAWAFFKVNEDIVATNLSDPATLAEARSYMSSKERGLMETWALGKAKEFVATVTGGNFAAASKKAGLKVKSAGPFPINYKAPSFVAYGQRIPLFDQINATTAEELAPAANSEKFFSVVFGLPKGAVSEPFVLEDNVIVMTVTDDTPAKDEEVAVVKFAYPYFSQGAIDSDVRTRFLKSSKFKDNFSTVFFQYFKPAANAKTSS